MKTFLFYAREILKISNPVPGTLDYWQRRTENERWAQVLDIRDWEYLLSCKEWEHFFKAIELLVPKYTDAWKFLGRPASTEDWLERSDYKVVDGRYWVLHDLQIDFSDIFAKKKRVKIHA